MTTDPDNRRIIVYYRRGELICEKLAALDVFLKQKCLEDAERVCDDPPCVAGLRRVFDAVKLGLCGTVIMPDESSLGDDRWLALDTELFFKRNGARLLFAVKRQTDSRYSAVNAIKAYYDQNWYVLHGDVMPNELTPQRADAVRPRAVPYFAQVKSGLPVRFCRSASEAEPESVNLSLPALEHKLDELMAMRSLKAAEALFNCYIAKQLELAEHALPQAVSAKDKAEAAHASLVKTVCDGKRQGDTRYELAAAGEAMLIAQTRLRRVETEKQLFSLSRERIDGFFSRAARPELLDGQEKAAMSKAFFKRLTITRNEAFAVCVRFDTGGTVKKDISGIIIK